MTLPVWSLSGERHELGLLVAVAIGFAFGFVLERAGFGRAQKLVAQFHGHDMTVFKVMFSAIVTAMLGTVVLGALGIVDYAALVHHAASETFLWPMIAGGFALGVGFIISGYCPGTSFVAAASGKLDGVATVAGVVLGQLAYVGLEHQPWLARFHTSGALGQKFLHELVGLPAPVGPAVLALAVSAMAIGCFIGAEKLERALASRAPAPASPAGTPGKLVLAGFAGVALFGLALSFVPSGSAAALPRGVRRITATDLEARVQREPWRLRVVDVRARDACAKARIPGAECVPLGELGSLALADDPGTRDLVLVADVTLDAIPAAASAYAGRVFTLAEGMTAWSSTATAKALAGVAVNAPPPPPSLGAPAARPRKTGGAGCGG